MMMSTLFPHFFYEFDHAITPIYSRNPTDYSKLKNWAQAPFQQLVLIIKNEIYGGIK